MLINIPEVVGAVRTEFARYEKALTTNDVPVLNELFWESEHTVRFGLGENLYGAAAIAAHRATRNNIDLVRTLQMTRIVTVGRDFAVASTEFTRTESGKHGRQQQTWVRMPEGWRVIAAHVSFAEC
jgi:hypothetical protein